jgi:hypothetical protein
MLSDPIRVGVNGAASRLEMIQHMAAIPAGGHLCLLYDDDPRQQLPTLVPFIKHGLDVGERCVYVADDLTIFDLHEALTADGVDVLREMTRGALLLLTGAEWRQRGELDSDARAAQVRAMIDDALDGGYKGVRLGVEMTWTLGPPIDAARLRDWEAAISTIFTPELPARMICQYSRWRLAPGALHAGIVTHPQAILGNGLYANPFYAAPRILAGEHPADTQAPTIDALDDMLRQLTPVPA